MITFFITAVIVYAIVLFVCALKIAYYTGKVNAYDEMIKRNSSILNGIEESWVQTKDKRIDTKH